MSSKSATFWQKKADAENEAENAAFLLRLKTEAARKAAIEAAKSPEQRAAEVRTAAAAEYAAEKARADSIFNWAYVSPRSREQNARLAAEEVEEEAIRKAEKLKREPAVDLTKGFPSLGSSKR